MSGTRPMNAAHPGDAALLAFKAECRASLGDVAPDEIADVCMVDTSMVSRWLSKSCRDSIGPDNIATLATNERTRAFARALVAYQARALSLVLTETESSRDLDVAGMQRTAKETMEAVNARAALLSDKSPATLLAFAREADEASAVLSSEAAAARRQAATFAPLRAVSR